MKTLKTLLFLSILLGAGLFLSQEAQAADWYSPDWQYRKAITVDNSANPSGLTIYQVLITLNAGNFEYSKANADGSDLRFTDANGLIEISYWVKEWNYGGDSKIWVKVPSVPALGAATVYLYYGNSSTTSSTSNFDTTMQKLGIDATSTVGLWHFDDATGTTLTDSSVNGNNGTLNNFAPDNSDWVADSASEYGGTGSALNFDGIEDYVEAAHNASLNLGTDDFTFEGWIYSTTTSPLGSPDMMIMSKYIDINISGIERGMIFYLFTAPDYIFRYDLWDFDCLEADGIFSPWLSPPLNDGSWHYFSAVREGINLKIYIDGLLLREENYDYTKVMNVDNDSSLFFGKLLMESEKNYFNGKMDEFRISKRALSAGEIKANYERRQYAAVEPTNSVAVTEEATPYDASEAIVVESGGIVTNEAETVAVDIPAAALATDTSITIEASEETGSFQVQGIEPIDYVYTFGPEGTIFSTPVTIVFNYDDTGMTLEEEQGLDVYYYNATTSLWEAQGATVDTALNTLTITVTHFSSFVVGGNIVLKEISKLLSLVDEFYEQGKIENRGIARSLSIQLRNAQRKIREGEIAVAIEMLENFASRVEKLSPKLIEPGAAEILIGKAQGIIAVLQ